MVKPNKEFDDMIDPVKLKEPDSNHRDGPKKFDPPKGIWMRGLMMIILAMLFALAETILVVVAIIQFLWMVFTREKNELLAEFGEDLSLWLAQVARFQTGASDRKPFPWTKWGDH